MAAQIRNMNALDLIGRLAVSPDGTEHRVVRLEFNAAAGVVVIWLREIGTAQDDVFGVTSIDGWTVD